MYLSYLSHVTVRSGMDPCQPEDIKAVQSSPVFAKTLTARRLDPDGEFEGLDSVWYVPLANAGPFGVEGIAVCKKESENKSDSIGNVAKLNPQSIDGLDVSQLRKRGRTRSFRKLTSRFDYPIASEQ